jgi:hypothetical protein
MEVSAQLYSQGKSPWYPLDKRLGVGICKCSNRIPFVKKLKINAG